jgi:hypothetical protein
MRKKRFKVLYKTLNKSDYVKYIYVLSLNIKETIIPFVMKKDGKLEKWQCPMYETRWNEPMEKMGLLALIYFSYKIHEYTYILSLISPLVQHICAHLPQCPQANQSSGDTVHFLGI